MIAEANEAGMLTTASGVADETIDLRQSRESVDSEVTEVLEALNVTESEAPKNFEVEKQRLINHINKTQQLGENYFDNKESHSFGKLNKTEWNNMLYKHLQHHLSQFAV